MVPTLRVPRNNPTYMALVGGADRFSWREPDAEVELGRGRPSALFTEDKGVCSVEATSLFSGDTVLRLQLLVATHFVPRVR